MPPQLRSRRHPRRPSVKRSAHSAELKDRRRDSQDRPDDQRLLKIAPNNFGSRICCFDLHPAYFNEDPLLPPIEEDAACGQTARPRSHPCRPSIGQYGSGTTTENRARCGGARRRPSRQRRSPYTELPRLPGQPERGSRTALRLPVRWWGRTHRPNTKLPLRRHQARVRG